MARIGVEQPIEGAHHVDAIVAAIRRAGRSPDRAGWWQTTMLSPSGRRPRLPAARSQRAATRPLRGPTPASPGAVVSSQHWVLPDDDPA